MLKLCSEPDRLACHSARCEAETKKGHFQALFLYATVMSNQGLNMRRAKIVATLGPSSDTVEKIKDGKKYFVLIDELFKGTNIQDAMKCSTAVIEGLQKSKTC